MAAKVTLDLPADLDERLRRETPNLDAEVPEAYSLELFRQGRLGHAHLARGLDLDRFETDAYLKRRGVFEGSLTLADLEADRQRLEGVMGKAR